MTNSTERIIGNRTVMNFAADFVSASKKLRKQELRDMNCVRLYKGIVLPFKLVGVDRRESTNTYMNNEEHSAIEWDHLRRVKEDKPIKKQY